MNNLVYKSVYTAEVLFKIAKKGDLVMNEVELNPETTECYIESIMEEVPQQRIYGKISIETEIKLILLKDYPVLETVFAFIGNEITFKGFYLADLSEEEQRIFLETEFEVISVNPGFKQNELVAMIKKTI